MDGPGGVGLRAGQPQQVSRAFREWSAWSRKHQWASNAAPKWAMAGVALWGRHQAAGADVGIPVRTRRRRRIHRRSVAGPRCPLTLPALELFPEPDLGRWETFVAVEHCVRVSLRPNGPRAPPGCLPGRWGLTQHMADRLGGTAYAAVSATCLKIGGVRVGRRRRFDVPRGPEAPVGLAGRGGAPVGHRCAYVRAGRAWDQTGVEVDVFASQGVPIGVGALVGLRCRVGPGGVGRGPWPARSGGRCSFRISRRGRFRALEYTFLDTAFSTLRDPPPHARRPRLHGRGRDWCLLRGPGLRLVSPPRSPSAGSGRPCRTMRCARWSAKIRRPPCGCPPARFKKSPRIQGWGRVLARL